MHLFLGPQTETLERAVNEKGPRGSVTDSCRPRDSGRATTFWSRRDCKRSVERIWKETHVPGDPAAVGWNGGREKVTSLNDVPEWDRGVGKRKCVPKYFRSV